jgi:uncharacterized protein (TIGR02118 family)
LTESDNAQPGSAGPKHYVRNYTVLTKRDDLTIEQFREYWTQVHAPMASALPGLVEYIQHHVVESFSRASFPAPDQTIDGITELVFESREAMHAALSSALGERLAEDARNFMSQMRAYVVEDLVIVNAE